jgi:hypothetical protein
MATKIDWSYWRHRFVTGDDTVTYRLLSEQPGAPAYATIKTVASKEDWTDQRKRYRYQQTTAVAIQPGVKETAEQVTKLVDTAEMFSRHIKAARLAGQKAIQAMQQTDPATLKPEQALAWLKFAVEAERLTEGLATQRQEVDLAGLSNAELEAIAKGG